MNRPLPPRPPLPPPRRRTVEPFAWVAAVVLGIGAVILVFPDVLGVDDRTPFVQIVAFRPQIAVAVTVLAALVALGGRRAWPVAAALGLVGLLGVATVLPRASGDPVADPAGPTFDVLTVNTYHAQADPDALAALVTRNHPAVVVLPEAGEDLQGALTSRLGSSYRSYIADRERDTSPMTVLVDRGVGVPTVTVDRSGEFPTIILGLPARRGVGALRVVATHPQSPKPGDTAAWRRDVDGLARWCSGGGPTVVAGDLNATFDHADLRSAAAGCTDAAGAVGEGLTGTWPATLPTALSAAIDHVLVARGPIPVSADVVDVPGSDHRGLLARLEL